METPSYERKKLTPFADKLRLSFQDLRVGGEMTQETVAAHLSEIEGEIVKQSYISKIEHGASGVSQRRWEHIAEAIGKSPEELYFEAIFYGVELSPDAARKVAEVRELIQKQFTVE